MSSYAKEHAWKRQCAVCYKRGEEKFFTTCDGCKAIVYCSETCKQADLDQGFFTPGQSHRCTCSVMKAIMAKEMALCDFPFSFSKVTTKRDFHEKKVARFLKGYGVCGQGLWRKECQVLKTGKRFENVERDILSKPPTSPLSPLSSWKEYYSFRCLPLESPVAIVLTYPLTLYYILTSCLRADASDLFSQIIDGGEVRIHILGVEKEAELKEIFLECARLLPNLRLMLVLYGKNSSPLLDDVWEKENLCISIRHQLYHESSDLKPHFAVAFNAGLPAYTTWAETVTKLLSEDVIAYFTDQSEFCCFLASTCVESLGKAGISPITINPFRSPVRVVTSEQNMPWFSNAFIFRLMSSVHNI
ncbi:zinc finger MYND domain-containing protein 15-like isoform X2 [Pomacea canaliculata]|uniref:zinc finger MYND domain-containing protein 15-like isoform X2 n=1 Tax=Pomacea canaliculata TaxID=400727 RepID=UPI000D739DF1|nr:zinc finger MYND domain-containing protein 15-like isoform X2 [Pomacea canaliculata]